MHYSYMCSVAVLPLRLHLISLPRPSSQQHWPSLCFFNTANLLALGPLLFYSVCWIICPMGGAAKSCYKGHRFREGMAVAISVLYLVASSCKCSASQIASSSLFSSPKCYLGIIKKTCHLCGIIV